MLQLERVDDPQEALRTALEGHQAQVWTALPAIIESFDPVAVTCVAQPAIKAEVRAPDGSKQWVSLPLLLDCPVVFPRGGGCTLTFPIAKGDECLIVFASRCIDAWWSAGGVQVQSEFRMHDLSDGFCLPGPFSQSTKISGISTTTSQLRSNDGSTYVEVNPAAPSVNVRTTGNITAVASGDIDATASGSINMSAAHITLNGPVTINGPLVQGTGSAGGAATINGPVTVTNDLTAAGKSVSTHTHHENGAGSNTNPPN